jgi:cobalt-zinc-cadmium efflux system outer membrane protein
MSVSFVNALPCLALACACASTDPGPAFEDVRALLGERGVENVHWNRGTAADAEVAESVGAMLQEELTVDAAVQIALLENASLQATYEELGIAQADLVQAGLLANPIFHGEIRFPGRPSEPLELDISQDFLSIFLMPLRKRVAASELEAAKLRVANAVLEHTARTRAAFYALQAAQQMLEMRSDVSLATEASAEAAERFHDAGNITDLELASEKAIASQAMLELSIAEGEVYDAREELVARMGLWGADAMIRVGSRLPELPETETSPEDLESLALSRRLDLLAARADVETTAQSLGIARYAMLLPEVGVTAHLEREPDGTTTTGPSLDIPIPLFDQGQAARARGWAILRQSEARYIALAVEIRSEVRRARNRMLSSRSRAEYYRAVLLPLHETIVEETQLEYNAMLTGVFQLLQSKQAAIETGRTYIEALREYWLSRTELEHAVGGPLGDALDERRSDAETVPVGERISS